MLQCNVFPGLPPDFLDSEVNLFLMPFMDSETESETPPRAGTVPPEGIWAMGRHGLPWFECERDSSWSEQRCRPVPELLRPFLGSVFPSRGRMGGPAPRLNSEVLLGGQGAVDGEAGPLLAGSPPPLLTSNFPGPGSSPLFSLLPGYRGHPSFQSSVSKLRSQVMSMARPQLSHTILTEKNW